MPDEVNFLDIVALSKITKDTYVEKFGGMINSSFFDASNILATLRQKGLIDFTNSFPGQSAITITEAGKKLLLDADDKGKSPFDHLDLEIITQLSQSKRTLSELGIAVNVRPADLAMHLWKLNEQQFLSYELRNGGITLALTEKGFIQVKQGMPPAPQPEQPKPPEEPQGIPPSMPTPHPEQPMPQPAPYAPQPQAPQPPAPQQPPVAEQQPSSSDDVRQLEMRIAAKKRKKRMATVLLVIVLIIIVVLILNKVGII